MVKLIKIPVVATGGTYEVNKGKVKQVRQPNDAVEAGRPSTQFVSLD